MLTLSVGNESINASEKTNLTLRQIIQFLIILWWLNVMKVAKIVARPADCGQVAQELEFNYSFKT